MAAPRHRSRAQNQSCGAILEVLGKSSLSDAEALQQKQLGTICSINTPASWDPPAAAAPQREGRAERATLPRAAATGNLHQPDTRTSPREGWD